MENRRLAKPGLKLSALSLGSDVSCLKNPEARAAIPVFLRTEAVAAA